MTAGPKVQISEAEYLQLDRAAEVRSEYLNGELFAMAGPSRFHNRINENLSGELYRLLKSGDCQSFSRDLRVYSQRTGSYTYSDALIVCGPPQFQDGQQDILLNPKVIFEIISPSSETLDRGLKFKGYLRLDSLEEYVLISQTEPRVEVYTRKPSGDWRFNVIDRLEDQVVLESVNISIAMADLYDRVEMESSE